MAMPLVETKNLKKYFKTGAGMLHAVEDVNLKIMPGKTLGVVGESGCGKSTLGRTILRLQPATAGEVLYNGENILKYKGKDMQKIHLNMQMVFQDPYSSLDPRMSVHNLIAEPVQVCGLLKTKAEVNEHVREIMDMCGLPADQANLFPHDLCVVKHISNEIMVMYMGQVVEHAKTAELFANPVHPYTKALLHAVPTIDLSRRNREGFMLRGEVTSPINPAPGCRFAPRCPYATDKCKENVCLKEVSPDHFVACSLCD